MSAPAPAYELLFADGKTSSPPAADLLADDSPSFIDCTALCGVRVSLAQATKVGSVRALFVPGGRTDALNSWVRDLLLPPPGSVSIEGAEAEERRWVWPEAGPGPGPQGVVLELRLSPRRLEQVTLRFPPGPWGLVRLWVQAEHMEGEPWQDAPVRDLPCYPPDQAALPRRGDVLAEQLAARGEPSLDGVRQLALPYRGGALLGVPEGPLAQVSWDGGIVVRHPDGDCDRLWFRLDLGPPTELGASADIALVDGWLPVSRQRSTAAGWSVQQTAFIDLSGTLRVRWEVQGKPPAAPLRLQLRAARSRLLRASVGGSAQRACHEPVEVILPTSAEGCECRLGSLRGILRPAPRRLLPDACTTIELSLPLSPSLPTWSFDDALSQVRAFWQDLLAAGAQLDLPDPWFQSLWRALCVHNRLFVRQGRMRYGLFPGVYEDALFGVEEGWNLVALAQYGQFRLAQEVLAATFFTAEFLQKQGQHHQYRNGLAPTYALDVFRLTKGLDWLRGLYPTVLESADWIIASLRSTRVLVDGERPPYYGLMPRHTYGGDLLHPTHSLYGSSACWRGLRDAAIIAEVLGDAATAARLTAEAAQARADMLEAARRIYRAEASPPFLPFQVDETAAEPSAGDYHQLFASLILETALFGWKGPFARHLTDFVQATGRLVLGVPRFDLWFGRLGVDAEYARGFQLAHLVRREPDRFWLGLLGQVGLSCDPFTFVSPETAIVRFTRQDHQDRMRALAHNPRRFDSDPCSAGTAVMLQYLRYLLAFEERDEDDLPTGRLWLAPAVPRAWFRPGVSFGAWRLPTWHGPISFRLTTEEERIVCEISSAGQLQVEIFFCDAQGQRRSALRQVAGQSCIQLPRCYA
ncbi:MAG: hypothetical protein NZ890_11870 [Myxococcota bacterium]|nr:hypothetical protein [Myxococcota bacterium]